MQVEPTLPHPVNRRAILSFVLAILALISFCIGAAPLPLTALVCYPFALLFGIAALWNGSVAIQQIRQQYDQGRSLALIGIWVGTFTILFVLCAITLVFLLWPYVSEFIRETWNQIPK